MLRNALFLLILILVFAGCGTTVDSASTQRQTATEVASVPTATPVDVSGILENATQLRDERVYLVTLKFKRSDFLDPIKNMFENEMKAVHETMVVGQSTYDQWTIGQEISSDFDGAGFFFNGDMATYSVTVEDKERLSEYYWVADDGSLNSMNADAYREAMRQLDSNPNAYTVPFAGSAVTYLLDHSPYDIVCETENPLTRYYVTVLVKNESLTLDITKMIRNEANTHEIEIEVPESMYENAATGEMWEPDWNTASMFFSGRFSRLHGYVQDRRSELDTVYNMCTTEDGDEFILPVNR